MVRENRPDHIMTDAVRFQRIVPKKVEIFPPAVEAAQTADRSHPQITGRVFGDGPDMVGGIS